MALLWQGMIFGRDNKALLMARNHKVLNDNSVACQLFGRAHADLMGMHVAQLIYGYLPSGEDSVWETKLVLPGAVVPVEVTREHFAAVKAIDVFAIRDLRPRREANRELNCTALRLRNATRSCVLNAKSSRPPSRASHRVFASSIAICVLPFAMMPTSRFMALRPKKPDQECQSARDLHP